VGVVVVDFLRDGSTHVTVTRQANGLYTVSG
jgi:hypothetical protein